MQKFKYGYLVKILNTDINCLCTNEIRRQLKGVLKQPVSLWPDEVIFLTDMTINEVNSVLKGIATVDIYV